MIEIDVRNQCVNLKLELKDGEETIDVCKAWAMDALKVPEAKRSNLVTKL